MSFDIRCSHEKTISFANNTPSIPHDYGHSHSRQLGGNNDRLHHWQ